MGNVTSTVKTDMALAFDVTNRKQETGLHFEDMHAGLACNWPAMVVRGVAEGCLVSTETPKARVVSKPPAQPPCSMHFC